LSSVTRMMGGLRFFYGKVQKKEKRKGLDLVTTLELIEKNFVIIDPRLVDNPVLR